MLNFIKEILITYNTYKFNNRLLKENTAALTAQNIREMDLAMTKLGEMISIILLCRIRNVIC
jgi:hypothetical protein